MDLLDLMQAPAARNSDPSTSHAAAQKAELHATENRLAVLRCLSIKPMTDFELAAELNRQQTSCGKRRGECRDHGLVQIALDGRGEEVKRPAPSGSMALVWEITQAGLEFLRQNDRQAA
jgi:hypothetical protein